MKKAIGIDLGGTSIQAGLVTDQGQILKKLERPTPTGGKTQVLNALKEIIVDLMEEGVIGIGIGSPGTIDSVNGRVLSIGGNIKDWAHTDIKGYLKNATGTVPSAFLAVDNDANAAALCEAWIGAGRDFRSFIMLTLGTGLGGAIYTREMGIYKGDKFQAGELGHAILYPHGRPCVCGQAGCVERYISGSALEDLYFEATGKKLKGKEIFALAQKEDKAKEIVDKFCENLAIYIASLKNILDPQAIIIGGGVINSKHIWWDKMIDYYQKHTNTPTAEIRPAKYLNNAGIIGAARLAFNNT